MKKKKKKINLLNFTFTIRKKWNIRKRNLGKINPVVIIWFENVFSKY
jgi:hypothetical protein